MATNPNRIDLHHHVISPELAATLRERGIDWNGGAGIPPWSRDRALENMDRYGIAAAIASVQPHAHLKSLENEVERWTRHSNEFLARVVQDDPDHFGGIASLPLPDVDAAMRELAYALDVLKLDGVHMLASHAGQYLGDPVLEELFQELNRRSAVVVLHPNTTPPQSEHLKMSAPPSLVEMLFDTTRAVANMLYTGVLHRYTNIRFVVPHAGGTVPYLVKRMEIARHLSTTLRENTPLGIQAYLKRLYYDTALSTCPIQLGGVKMMAGAGQIVYGSDFPYAQGPILGTTIQELETLDVFDDAEREMINRGNALRLLPRFASVPVA